jgi:valyl-tRNA synthetase
MTQPYPESDPAKIDTLAIEDVEWLKGIVVGIRNIRGEMDISPGKPIPVLLNNGDDNDLRRFDDYAGFVKSLAKLESMIWLKDEEAPMSATQLVGKMEVLVPMAGLIDVEAEITRLNKELEKAGKEITRLEGKLSNEKFVSNAPADVVAKEQEKLVGARAIRSKLSDQMEKIKSM